MWVMRASKGGTGRNKGRRQPQAAAAAICGVISFAADRLLP